MFQHVKYTHTHNRLTALFPVLPGWAVPVETFTHWYPSGRRRKRRIHTDNKLLCLGAHSLYGALSQRGMLVLIKPACNQGRPDGRLKLTASFFDWLNQYAGYSGHNTYCYAKLAASCISFHHYCSPSSGFYGAGKDNRQRHTDNPSRCHPIWTIGVPTSIISPFLRNPLSQPSQFILTWDRYQIMLACIPSGLVQHVKIYCKSPPVGNCLITE